MQAYITTSELSSFSDSSQAYLKTTKLIPYPKPSSHLFGRFQSSSLITSLQLTREQMPTTTHINIHTRYAKH